MAGDFASAAARDLAERLSVADAEIVGTGRHGRVTVDDVRRAAPTVPAGFDDAAAAFYLSVRSGWQLRPDEEQLLLAACRTIDEIARLEAALATTSVTVPGSKGQPRAHPLVRELREHRLALKQLLGAAGIGISDAADADAELGSRRSDAGRKLALIRHNRSRG